jgi:hypothetical protein
LTRKNNRPVKKTAKLSVTPKDSKIQEGNPLEAAVNLDRVEFHRNGLALVPGAERRPGVAYIISGDKRLVEQRYCSCSLAARQTCPQYPAAFPKSVGLDSFFRGEISPAGF